MSYFWFWISGFPRGQEAPSWTFFNSPFHWFNNKQNMVFVFQMTSQYYFANYSVWVSPNKKKRILLISEWKCLLKIIQNGMSRKMRNSKKKSGTCFAGQPALEQKVSYLKTFYIMFWIIKICILIHNEEILRQLSYTCGN